MDICHSNYLRGYADNGKTNGKNWIFRVELMTKKVIIARIISQKRENLIEIFTEVFRIFKTPR